MSRPTPETDAFITSQDYYPTGHQWRNFTRKLERERDEARSLTEHQWLLKVGSRLFVAGCKSDGIIDSLDEIIRERDEARKMLVRSNHFLQQAEENLESIYKERDEWKNKAYSHATDYTLMEAKCFRLEQQLKEYDKLKS